MSFNPIGHGVALLLGEERREIFHDPRVCIEASKRDAISRNPLPQAETRGSQFGRHKWL
jgi:hypothetical protein